MIFLINGYRENIVAVIIVYHNSLFIYLEQKRRNEGEISLLHI
jgi:hypothetical protein